MPPHESFETVIRLNGTDIDLSEFQVPRKDVDHLRQLVLDHLEEDGVRDEYNESDLSWLLYSRPYQIERFAMSAMVTGADGLQLIKQCLRWRKETDLNRLTDESFPREFFEKGGLFAYKEDVNGTPLLYMRIKMVKNYHEIEPLLKLFLAYQVSKIDNSCSSLMGWAIVFDCSGIGIANVQLDMMRYLIAILRDYFPGGIRYVLVYDLPLILRWVQKLIFAMIPDEVKKQIFFKTRSDVTDMIPESNLPDYMGGTCKDNYKQAPAKCLAFRQLFRDQYKPREFDRIQKILDSV